jgi:hypothetical protein
MNVLWLPNRERGGVLQSLDVGSAMSLFTLNAKENTPWLYKWKLTGIYFLGIQIQMETYFLYTIIDMNFLAFFYFIVTTEIFSK